MNSLIHEKAGVTDEMVKMRQNKVIALAKDLFVVEGDQEIKDKLTSYVENIASVKPGRKLIKALVNNKLKIKIKKGEDFFFRPDDSMVEVGNEENCRINTIDPTFQQKGVKHPTWIMFAHELIHLLHHHNKEYLKTEKTDILPGMNDLEEQIAIIGYNPRKFTKSNALSAIEIICENAFYLALGLLPRIDHKRADNVDPVEAKHPKAHVVDAYYVWLENTLNSISKIPEDKKDDKEFILKYLDDYPSAASTLSDKLKSDYDFILQLIVHHHEMLVLTPLCKDKQFMMQAVQVQFLAPFYADSELFKDKEFILKMYEGQHYYSKPAFKKWILDKIDPSLLNDPDLKQILT